ncbi:MAG: 50S ribosomal protein L24 [Minisyncoccia bacterium]
MKIKKGDEIKIITGKDKGKTGRVTRVFPQDNSVLVEGLNLFKKHMRPRQQGKKGEVILVPKPVDVSAVRLVCPKCRKTGRVGYDLSSGRKARICKKCLQTV